MPRLVVKKHRPLEIILAFLLFSAVFSIITWFLLDTNHWDYIKSRLTESEQSSLLWQVNKELEKENAVLREKVIMLERSTQIDEQTAKLQNDIRLLQDQTYRLKGELEFYQGIMSDAKDSQGLNVQGLHIEPTDQERLFRFKLVLTNVAKSDKVIEVTMDMSVEGVNESGSKILPLKELLAGSQINRDIKFKNFERIDGNLVFPEGFKPLRVLVDLQQKGSQKKPTVQRVFEWPANAG
mgnify:CR=1 FL=1